jgi:hypothetical protein
MKEVRVYSKNFREDSIENRIYYNKIFNYQKPGVATSINPGSGSVGMDLDEFINIFGLKETSSYEKCRNVYLNRNRRTI